MLRVNRIGVACVIAILVMMVLSIHIQAFTKNKVDVDIVDIDSIAYVKVDNEVAKLLDTSGRQVVFNTTLNSEHSLTAKAVEVGDNKLYIVYDEMTDMYYIGVKELATDELVRTVNVMYHIQDIKGE